MPRPSSHTDKRLIRAGLDMMRESGLSNLNVREIARRAEVNLGMFHYHFKSKDAFVRSVLQELYESVFTQLTLCIDDNRPAIAQLQGVLKSLVLFGRDHRHILINIVADISLGNSLATDFAQRNFPRHAALIHRLVKKAQEQGAIKKVSIAQIISFLAGAIAGPVLLSTLATKLDLADVAHLEAILEKSVLSDSALEQRIEMALKGVAP